MSFTHDGNGTDERNPLLLRRATLKIEPVNVTLGAGVLQVLLKKIRKSTNNAGKNLPQEGKDASQKE